LNDLRKIVYDKLATVLANVYFDRAKQGTTFPYAVFSFPAEGRHYKEQVARELEVSLYDVAKSGYNVASAIEDMADEIVRVLDYSTGSHGDTSVWFRIDNRIETPFPDGVDMWGRTLQFTARTYKE
jgi:hypothetical protein